MSSALAAGIFDGVCGIVGYVGKREGGRPVQELLLDGLKKLEYRGYDSAGISVIGEDRIETVRAVGNLDALQAKLDGLVLAEEQRFGSRPPVAVAVRAPTTGIGHTRWATHGRVTEENAHPHYDSADRFHVVVNGIVENYMTLKERLLAAGSVFTSETDAEVIAHLIAEHYDGDLADAVRAAYAELEGHYAFVAMCLEEPETLVGARRECPLIVGRGEGEQFVASAVPAFLAQTREVQYLDNGEIVVLTPDGVTITTPGGDRVERAVETVDWDEDTAEKGGYETFMLKEIHEQADAVAETIADRTARGSGVDLGEQGVLDEAILADVKRIVVVACGTSYHAGLIGRYAIEEWARVPVEVDVASEYRYRNPVVGPGDLVIGISQSGETADTLAAMRKAKERGAAVLAITNVMGSQVTRDADGVLFTRAGLEIRVAATKTFLCQVAVVYLLALRLAELRGTLEPARIEELVGEVKRLPHGIEQVLSRHGRAGGARRRRVLAERVLPLHRPPRRPAGRAGGRIEAEGDLLHRHRRIPRGRDEARPDRAAGRVHAGGVRGDRFAGVGEDGVEHAGGARARRARGRGDDGGQRADRKARRLRDNGAGGGLDAAADAGGDPAAAARL